MTNIAMQAPPIEPAGRSSRPNLDKGFNPLSLILFVGREYLRKGGDVLVEAFRKVREWNPRARLRFVGTKVSG